MIPLSVEYAIREGQQRKDGKHSHVLLATYYHCPDLPTHSELCRHLWRCIVVSNDYNLTERDKAIISLLWDSLKRDPEHKDRKQTAWGTKTKFGLARCLDSIYSEFKDEGLLDD